MDGIQKTVAEGLRYLTNKVEEGLYGEGDNAFQGDDDSQAEAFLSDLHDYVIDKME